MKIISRLLALILLIHCFTASASVTGKRIKVACIGNSITYGMTLENRDSESYPAQLAKLLGEGYEVGNFGKNGATLLNKGHRPYTQQDEFKQALKFVPDIIVIHLGINDTDPRDFPYYSDSFASDYISLIDSFKNLNPDVRVILANLSPILSRHPRFRAGTLAWRDSIREIIPKIADTAGAQLIDFGEALRDRPNLIPDAIHPSAKGAAILARHVFRAITGDFGGLRLPPVYGHGMVLQRFRPLNITGYGNPGNSVTVELGPNVATATVNPNGKWTVTLPPMAEAVGLNLKVISDADSLFFSDVAIGEVWVASGQSNMEFQMKFADSFKEDKDSFSDPLLRFFDMKPIAYTDPYEWPDSIKDKVDDLGYYLPTNWQLSNPQTVSDFSALAWYFAKNLRDKLNVPVGIISNAIGGSPAESWIDIETLEHTIPEILNNWQTNIYLQPWAQGRIIENIGKDSKSRRHPYEPSYLFAAAIRPLSSYPVAGTIWYQGESNAHNIEIHETLFPALVESWRNEWNLPQMPFYFVQLSSINRSSWPAFRDSQRRLALALDNVEMAVSSDKGNPQNVHPVSKKPIGERLARLALNKVYGMANIVPQGPTPIYASLVGPGTVKIKFNNVADGLKTTNDSIPLSFEIAGNSGIFMTPDSVEISGNDEITIKILSIEQPIELRYGWQPVSKGNLVNSELLPTSTFKLKISSPYNNSLETGYDNGVSGAFAGVVDGYIIQAGGCNFPSNPMAPDSKKKFYEGVYLLNPNSPSIADAKRVGTLPRPLAYGASVETPQGLILIGGSNDEDSFSDVYLLKYNEAKGLELSSITPLPVKADNFAAAYADGKVYVAGGNIDASPSNSLFMLDLNSPKNWKKLKPFPGNPRTQPLMEAGKDSKGNQYLYIWGGFAVKSDNNPPSLNTDGLRFDIKRNKWQSLPPPLDSNGEEISLGGAASTRLPDGRIMATGGVNKDVFLEALKSQDPDYLSHPVEWYRFNENIMIFDPASASWTIVGKDKKAARAGANLITLHNGNVILTGGEIKPRIRTSEILPLKFNF